MAKTKDKGQTVHVRFTDTEVQLLAMAKKKMRGKGKDAPWPSNSYVVKQALRVYLGG